MISPPRALRSRRSQSRRHADRRPWTASRPRVGAARRRIVRNWPTEADGHPGHPDRVVARAALAEGC
ncbi:hypothetical protein HBB16_13710 [Pseudonocardia sp. MCCB 268]|nr:hypothetical protein [Pseudonocardia cytotoxica]